MKLNSERYFTTIEELSLYNWIRCNEDKDKRFLRKGKKGSENEDLFHWDHIYSAYIDEYGLSKYYVRILKQYKRKAEAELKHVITEDQFELTLINMETQKLERILANGGNGIGTEQTLIHLSKWIGYWIKSKEISVKEFFDLSHEYNRVNKITNGENK
tara:strand:+ start:4141 stop:4614 length:474 start_codon:yes stop_codon:yes gene_type:complete